MNQVQRNYLKNKLITLKAEMGVEAKKRKHEVLKDMEEIWKVRVVAEYESKFIDALAKYKDEKIKSVIDGKFGFDGYYGHYECYTSKGSGTFGYEASSNVEIPKLEVKSLDRAFDYYKKEIAHIENALSKVEAEIESQIDKVMLGGIENYNEYDGIKSTIIELFKSYVEK